MGEIIELDLKKEFTKKQSCFSQLTDNEIEMLANLLTEQPYLAGETIVTEGDIVDSVYLIVSGTADVRHISYQNDVLVTKSLATLTVGNAIGLNDTGFYSVSGVRTATVVALTDMVTLRLSLAAFHGFSLTNSHVNEIMHNNAQAATNGNGNGNGNGKSYT